MCRALDVNLVGQSDPTSMDGKAEAQRLIKTGSSHQMAFPDF